MLRDSMVSDSPGTGKYVRMGEQVVDFEFQAVVSSGRSTVPSRTNSAA